jgi:hypothetical protein
VWQHYLSPWTNDKKIWCLRNGKAFHTSTENIALERDFYKIKAISQRDIEFIKALASRQHFGVLNKFNDWWIVTLKLISDLHAGLANNEKQANEVAHELDVLAHNFEEDYHEMIERTSINYTKSILKEDLSFFDDDHGRAEFSYYLCMQFVRTKKIQENVFLAFKDAERQLGVNINNSWPLMRNINAVSIAYSLFSQRKYKIVLLKNTSDINFITGDQPVFNTHAVEQFGKEIPASTEFYYALSPRIAILITDDQRFQNLYEIELNDSAVGGYNNFVKQVSYEQIYSCTQECLMPFM